VQKVRRGERLLVVFAATERVFGLPSKTLAGGWVVVGAHDGRRRLHDGVARLVHAELRGLVARQSLGARRLVRQNLRVRKRGWKGGAGGAFET